MPAPILVLENVGKSYEPGQERKDTLRDLLSIGRVFLRNKFRTHCQRIWALQGVNTIINPGEIVGIIGHNGAGKSTLLKLISRITAPCEGRIQINGTLASLLEVGVGFHPDLTGRENVYLSGAFLRLKKREVEQSIASIQEFAEIGEAFDRPVRTYSSGMYMRLGFAVAAHLKTDIILLDEVLAVGDLRFQQKCHNFLQDLQRKNVTIILVSHNLFLVKSLCSRVLYLKEGRLAFDGDPVQAVTLYEQDSYLSVPDWATHVRTPATGDAATILDIEPLNLEGETTRVFRYGEPLQLRLCLRCWRPIPGLNLVISVIRQDGVACCAYSSHLDGIELDGKQGFCTIYMTVPRLKWVADSYRIDALIWDGSFQKLYAAAKGPYISVTHPLLSKEFGVFHEEAIWETSPELAVDISGRREP